MLYAVKMSPSKKWLKSFSRLAQLTALPHIALHRAVPSPMISLRLYFACASLATAASDAIDS
jgi:hypothetical protein